VAVVVAVEEPPLLMPVDRIVGGVGFTGLLLTAVFSATAGGLGLGEGQTIGGQLGVQFIGALATAVWCAVATFVILKAINVAIPLRVSGDDENQGLDISQHDERGYNP
jgi:Amt family ammonium transporter